MEQSGIYIQPYFYSPPFYIAADKATLWAGENSIKKRATHCKGLRCSLCHCSFKRGGSILVRYVLNCVFLYNTPTNVTTISVIPKQFIHLLQK